MKKITYDMFDRMEVPFVVLSTRYHKHLGEIPTYNLNSNFNMQSFQEVSFDVYKYVDGKECKLWDDIVDFKYIYIPDHEEYYEIYVKVDETNNTVKHISTKSAAEVELSNRMLFDFHCNDEIDIERKDYSPTIIYNPDKPEASLLNRVLHDKYSEWTIGHVDSSIAKIQRTFTADKTNPYNFLTTTVAQEVDGLFVFDSVNRVINLYDLDNICNDCGHRSGFVYQCPKCGSTNFTEGYGVNTGIYISTENFAEQISIDGDTDNVRSAFKVSGGDELITATVANLNPNGSNYIYRFSDDMMSDMPEELVKGLKSYEVLYASKLDEYNRLTDDWYHAVDNIMYLTSGMMPETPIPGETTAKEQLENLRKVYEVKHQTVAVGDISKDSETAYDLAVQGYSEAILDPRYTVEIVEKSSHISDLSSGTRVWTGKLTVKSLGKLDDTGEIEEATSETDISVTVNGDEEEFLYQKIKKTLDRNDVAIQTLFDIEDDDEFKIELTKYCKNRLKSFYDTYTGALEIMAKQGVTNENQEFYHVDLYGEMYQPTFVRRGFINDELQTREKEIKEAEDNEKTLSKQRQAIKDELNLENYLGEDLYTTFKLYIRESEFNNSNYISTGLDLEGMDYNTEVINKAQELLDVANEELMRASELQVTLNDELQNLLNTKEFKKWKDKFEIGDWILNSIDDKLYKLRLIGLNIDYDQRSIQVTFSNSIRYRNHATDVKSILSSAQSIANTYNYTAHQAKQGDEAKTSINEMQTNGVDASTYNVLAGADNGVVIDEHGILCTAIDDETGTISDKQLKIINNMLAFTDDAWKTVSTAIGEIKYRLNGEEHTAYGVNANIMVAGTMISGDIYSSNYSSTPKTGTHINLNDGSFDLAGGKIEYNKSTDVLDINVAHINYGSGVNAPTVSQIDGLSTALAAKQDKLTAGTNITIDANNVISATGGGSSNIYFGENVPSDSYGENESIYIQYNYSIPTLSDTDYEGDVIELVSFEEQSDGTYDLVVGGKPTAQTADYIEFNLENFIVGNEYTITFDLKFNDEATFPWTHVNDFVSVGSEQVIFESDTVQHSYSITFTAAGNDKLHFQFNRVNDVEYFTATITDLTIIGDGAVEIVDIYGKIQDGWRLYNPSIDVDELSDVEISNLANGEVLKYDSTLGKWVNDNGGSDISVTPVVLQGTNIADITIDGITTHLYTPNNGNDIYTGTSEPVASLGSDGDLYYQYRIEQGGDEIDYEIEPGNDTNMPYTSTTDVNNYGIVVIRISAGRGASWFDTTFEVNIDDIGTDSQNPTVIFTRDTYDGVINLYCYNDNGYLNFSYTFAEGAVLRALGFKVGDTYHKVAIYTKDDGYWKKNIESGGGGTGNVDDVYVNGTSVLDSNHIAQIKSYKELTQAEYDALPSSKLSDDIMYCITDAGVTEGDTFAPIIYSLEEREVGTWTDGKPLYQRSFIRNNITLYSNAWYNSDIYITNGIAVKGEIVNYEVDGAFYNVYANIETSGRLCLLQTRNTDIGITNAVITVWYTKTTDIPGSAQYTPLGVPAVHYDNTEKIIGTWFGETLYEKSYEIDPNSTGTIIEDMSSYLNEVIEFKGSFFRYISSSDYRWYPFSGRSESSSYNGYFVKPIVENGVLKIQISEYPISEILKIRLTVQYTKI